MDVVIKLPDRTITISGVAPGSIQVVPLNGAKASAKKEVKPAIHPLVALALEKAHSPTTLARALRVTQGCVTKWSKGTTAVGPVNLAKLKKYLGDKATPPKKETTRGKAHPTVLAALAKAGGRTALSRQLGVAYGTMYRWHTGKQRPQPAYLKMMQGYLDSSEKKKAEPEARIQPNKIHPLVVEALRIAGGVNALSKALGISYSRVWSWKARRRQPRPKSTRKLREYIRKSDAPFN